MRFFINRNFVVINNKAYFFNRKSTKVNHWQGMPCHEDGSKKIQIQPDSSHNQI